MLVDVEFRIFFNSWGFKVINFEVLVIVGRSRGLKVVLLFVKGFFRGLFKRVLVWLLFD